MSTQSSAPISFEYAGYSFVASWLNAERTRLSVRCLDALEEDGADAGDITWPSDGKMSRIVGKVVSFHDKGDDLTEAIFHA